MKMKEGKVVPFWRNGIFLLSVGTMVIFACLFAMDVETVLGWARKTADLRKANHEKLYAYVTKYTRYLYLPASWRYGADLLCSAFWGQSFVGQLTSIADQAKKKADKPTKE